jgi:hypothetical protein
VVLPFCSTRRVPTHLVAFLAIAIRSSHSSSAATRTDIGIKVFGDLSTIPVVDYGAITEAMAKGILDGSKAAIDALDPELASVAKGYKAFITYHSTQGK